MQEDDIIWEEPVEQKIVVKREPLQYFVIKRPDAKYSVVEATCSDDVDLKSNQLFFRSNDRNIAHIVLGLATQLQLEMTQHRRQRDVASLNSSRHQLAEQLELLANGQFSNKENVVKKEPNTASCVEEVVKQEDYAFKPKENVTEKESAKVGESRSSFPSEASLSASENYASAQSADGDDFDDYLPKSQVDEAYQRALKTIELSTAAGHCDKRCNDKVRFGVEFYENLMRLVFPGESFLRMNKDVDKLEFIRRVMSERMKMSGDHFAVLWTNIGSRSTTRHNVKKNTKGKVRMIEINPDIEKDLISEAEVEEVYAEAMSSNEQPSYMQGNVPFFKWHIFARNLGMRIKLEKAAKTDFFYKIAWIRNQALRIEPRAEKEAANLGQVISHYLKTKYTKDAKRIMDKKARRTQLNSSSSSAKFDV